jgi:hypothetical protein
MAVFIIRARYGAATPFDSTPTAYFNDVPYDAFGYQWIPAILTFNISHFERFPNVSVLNPVEV